MVSPILIIRSGVPDTITQNSLYPGVVRQRPHSLGFNYGGYAPEMTSEGQAIRYLLAPSDPQFPYAPSGRSVGIRLASPTRRTRG